MQPNPRSSPSSPLLAALTIIALLTISGATEAFSVQNGGPASSTTAQKWWSSQYAYRQSVNVTNPSASPLSNYPVFLQVAFPFSHLSDATAQLRLVNQNGAEVPSYVLDEVSSNGFVTSAWVLAFVSLAASSSGAFELYYGSTTATTPFYRMDSAIAKAQTGRLSLDVSGSEPATSSFQVTLGGTYSEQESSRRSATAREPSRASAQARSPSPPPRWSPPSASSPTSPPPSSRSRPSTLQARSDTPRPTSSTTGRWSSLSCLPTRARPPSPEWP